MGTDVASGLSVSILSAASAACSACGSSLSGAGTPCGSFDTGEGPRDESADLVSSTAEDVMTTGVVSSATVGDRMSELDIESFPMGGRSSSARLMLESSRHVFINWILADARLNSSMFFSLSPSSFEFIS